MDRSANARTASIQDAGPGEKVPGNWDCSERCSVIVFFDNDFKAYSATLAAAMGLALEKVHG